MSRAATFLIFLYSLKKKNPFSNSHKNMLIREEDFFVVTCFMVCGLWQIIHFFSKYYILISFWAPQELFRRKQR